jgi:hypothetical protein
MRKIRSLISFRLCDANGWASDVFDVGKFVTSVFRADIRHLGRKSNGYVSDKCTMGDPAIARWTDVWRALKGPFSEITAVVPFRFNEFKCWSDSAVTVITTSDLNHSLAGSMR